MGELENNYNNKNKLHDLPAMFTLKESRDILPDIIKITEKYYNKVEKIRIKLFEAEEQSSTNRLEDQINKLIQKWAEEMSKYDVKVAGLWNVDFDSGDGIYYCWKYPEEDILFFHLYETGLSGRRPISLLEN